MSDIDEEEVVTPSEPTENQGTGTISCEKVTYTSEVLQGYMDAIRNEINNTGFFSSTIEQYKSTTRNPNNIVEQAERFFTKTEELLSILEFDTRYVEEIGQKLSEQDEKLSGLVDDILKEQDVSPSTTPGATLEETPPNSDDTTGPALTYQLPDTEHLSSSSKK